MKILYLHQYFITPSSSGGTRSYEFARRWAAEGHNITILSGRTIDPVTSTGDVVEIEGFKLKSIGMRYNSRMNYFVRSLLFLEFMIRSIVYVLFTKKPDIVLATSTPLSIAVPAILMLKLRGVRYVLEVRDVWPDAIVDAGVVKNRIIISVLRLLERAAYRNAEKIVTLSTGMTSRVIKNGAAAEKISMIPNCSDIGLFQRAFEGRSYGEDVVKAPKNLLYMGSINLANGIEIIQQAILDLKEENLIWHFVGDGNRRDILQKVLAENGVSNVKFHGWVKKRELIDLLPKMDVGIVSFIDMPVYFENSPNKFFDYISAGLPVLFTRSTWLKEQIEEYRCGMVCESGSVTETVENIKFMLSDANDLSQMSSAARKLAENRFNRDMHASSYLDLLDSVVQNT